MGFDWRKNGPDSIEARSSELGVSLRNINLACFLYSANCDSLCVISCVLVLTRGRLQIATVGKLYLFIVDRSRQGQSLSSANLPMVEFTVLDSGNCCRADHCLDAATLMARALSAAWLENSGETFKIFDVSMEP